MTTRIGVLGAWEAAQRRADADGGLTLSAAAFAGHALVQAGGDASAAMAFVPDDAVVFWGRVRSLLLAIVAEELDRRVSA
jgi:hypothetical protein